jgi:hypothetical protein
MSKRLNELQIITTADVTDLLVGITPVYLNTFIHRKLYGLAKPEVRKGEKGDKQRVFSEADVYAIALVWMLFESGLRTQAIRRIMNQLAGTKVANARITAEALRKSKAEYIVVVREPRKPKGKTKPEPKISTAKTDELPAIVAGNATANVLLIPIGQKFEDIRKRIEVLF